MDTQEVLNRLNELSKKIDEVSISIMPKNLNKLDNFTTSFFDATTIRGTATFVNGFYQISDERISPKSFIFITPNLITTTTTSGVAVPSTTAAECNSGYANVICSINTNTITFDYFIIL